MKYILTIITVLGLNLTLTAQSISDIALTDVKSETMVSLSDFKDMKGIVIIFTSNVCPYSVYYEGRITQLISDFEKRGIQFLLVNSHLEDKESISEMGNKISTWGLKIPYLADKDQHLMEALGARKSPQVFILKPNGSQFTVYFAGAIDNNPQVASDVKEQYLRENISNLLSGNAASQVNTRPIGCSIKTD